MNREFWAQRQREVRERQRLYLLGITHGVPVWPELARKSWRIE